MNPSVAALIGLVARFILAGIVIGITCMQQSPDLLEDRATSDAIAMLLVATNALLGGILAVLLWQAVY